MLKRNLLTLAILAIFSALVTFISVRNIPLGTAYIMGEFPFSFHYKDIVTQILSYWNPSYNLGFANTSTLYNSDATNFFLYGPTIHFFDFFILFLTQTLFGPLVFPLYFFYGYFAQAIGLFLLVSYYAKKLPYKSKVLITLIISLLVMVTPYKASVFASGTWYFFNYGLFFTSWYIYLQIKDRLQGKKSIVLLCCVLLLLFILFTTTGVNLFALYLALVIFDLVLSFFPFKKKRVVVWTLGIVLLFAMSAFFINGYFYVVSSLFKESFLNIGPFYTEPLPNTIPQILTLSVGAATSNIYYWIYPTLAFIGFFFLPKKLKIFTLILFFPTVFFTKGDAEPFSGLSLFLFRHIPFMTAYQSTHRFLLFIFLIYILCYIYLFSYLWQKSGRGSTLMRWGVFICIIYCLVRANPAIFSGNFNFIEGLRDNKDYENAKTYLQSVNGRVFYFPVADQTIANSYTWSPSNRRLSFYSEPFTNAYPLPNLSSVGPYYRGDSSRLVNYFVSNYLDSPDLMKMIFAKTNTQYIVIDTNIKKDDTQAYEQVETALSTLNTSQDFTKIKTFGGLLVYKNNDITSYVSTTSDPIYVLGDLRAYKILFDAGVDLLKHPIIFLSQLSPQEFAALPPKKHIVITNEEESDLVGFWVNKLPISIKQATEIQAEKGWVYDTAYYWKFVRDFGIDYDGEEDITTFGKNTITLQFSIPKNTTYNVLIRPIFYPDGGKVSFLLDNKPYSAASDITDTSVHESWRILPHIYLTKGVHHLSLISLVDNTRPIFNEIALAKTDDIHQIQNMWQSIQKKEEVISPNDLSENVLDSNSSKVSCSQRLPSYQRPDVYGFSIPQQCQKNAWIFLSASYSPYLEIKNSIHMPIDYFANGYFVSNAESKYTITHKASFLYRIFLLLPGVVGIFLLALIGIKLVQLLRYKNHGKK